ncbi:hypothetical protein, partial [Companilactobacillus bobalius]
SSSQVSQLPSTLNLFSGSAVGSILLSGPSTNYDNVQDGLLITLSNLTSDTLSGPSFGNRNIRFDLSSVGLTPIKIPKEKLVVNSSIDISDQLSQYIGKKVQAQLSDGNSWEKIDDFYNNISGFTIKSFGGASIKVLPNTTLSINLTAHIFGDYTDGDFKIPVIQVNTYKN